MPRKSSITRFLKPWSSRQDQIEQERLQLLRRRDGDSCRRCRRPMHFDLPSGHDRAPAILQIRFEPTPAAAELDNLCLCHARCNPRVGDNTDEVQERLEQMAG